MSEERHKTFVMYTDIVDAVFDEPPEVQARVLMDICIYAAYGIEPKSRNDVTLLLNAFRSQIDANRAKYEKKAAERRASGSKGGTKTQEKRRDKADGGTGEAN